MPKRKNPSNKSDKISISKIHRVFNKYPKKSFNYKQISRAIGAGNNAQKKLAAQALNEMCKKKILKEVRPGNYQLFRVQQQSNSFTVKGVVDMTTTGAAFVLVEGVVLPQPDSPTSPTIVPLGTSKLAPETALICKSPTR